MKGKINVNICLAISLKFVLYSVVLLDQMNFIIRLKTIEDIFCFIIKSLSTFFVFISLMFKL